MALLSILRHDKKAVRGFSLLEVIIVLAIMGIIIALSAATSFDSYKGYIFRTERSVLVTVLERARSRAMNNYFGSPQGVCYIAPNYILFRGTDCIANAATNELIPANDAISRTGLSPSQSVVFEQLTGNLLPQLASSTDEKRIELRLDWRTADITINNEGRIEW